MKRPRPSYLLWLVAAAVISFTVAVGSLRASSGIEELAGILEQVDGTAARPFVYRQLVPAAVRAVMSPLPREEWTRLGQRAIDSGAVAAFERWTGTHYAWWNAQRLAPIFISAFFNFAAALGLCIVLRSLLEGELSAPRAFHAIVPLVVTYALLFLNREGAYSYDLPQAFLFTTGLWMLAQRKLHGFYVVFALGLVNKETTVLLSLVFAVLFLGRMRLSSYVKHGAAQVAIFLFLRTVLEKLFLHNPGQAQEWHLFDHNMLLFLNPKLSSEILTPSLVLVGLACREWRSKPVMFRRACIATFFPLAATTALFGWIDELRDFIDVFPIFATLVAISLARDVFGASVTARQEDDMPLRDGIRVLVKEATRIFDRSPADASHSVR